MGAPATPRSRNKLASKNTPVNTATDPTSILTLLDNKSRALQQLSSSAVGSLTSYSSSVAASCARLRESVASGRLYLHKIKVDLPLLVDGLTEGKAVKALQLTTDVISALDAALSAPVSAESEDQPHATDSQTGKLSSSSSPMKFKALALSPQLHDQARAVREQAEAHLATMREIEKDISALLGKLSSGIAGGMVDSYEKLRDRSEDVIKLIQGTCASASQLESTARARDALLLLPNGGKKKAYVSRGVPSNADSSKGKVLSTSKPKAIPLPLPPVKAPRGKTAASSPSTSASGGPPNITSSSSPDVFSPARNKATNSISAPNSRNKATNSISAPNSRPSSNAILPPSVPNALIESPSASPSAPKSQTHHKTSAVLHTSSPQAPHASFSHASVSYEPKRRAASPPPRNRPRSVHDESLSMDLHMSLEELLRHNYRGRAGANMASRVATSKDWDVALSILDVEIEDERAKHRHEVPHEKTGEGKGLKLPDIRQKSGGGVSEGGVRKQAWTIEEGATASPRMGGQGEYKSASSDDTDELLSKGVRSRARVSDKSVLTSLHEVKKLHLKGIRGLPPGGSSEGELQHSAEQSSPGARFERARIEKRLALAYLEHEYKAS